MMKIICFFYIVASVQCFGISNINMMRIKGLASQLKMKYNPYESDPVLISKVKAQMIILSDMSTDKLKTELQENGSSTSVFDREDLIKRVAIARVQINETLNNSSNVKVKLEAKEKRTQALLFEIDNIRQMETVDIIEELNLLRVPFEKPIVRSDLIRQLALCRVDNIRVEYSGSINSANGDVNVVGDGVKKVVKEKWTKVNNRVSSIKQVTKDFSDRVMYTDSEKSALEELDDNQMNNNDEIYIDSSSQISSQQTLQSHNFNSFDEARAWALTAPYTTISKLCAQYGIPTDGNRDELASILADAIMSAQNIANITTTSSSTININNNDMKFGSGPVKRASSRKKRNQDQRGVPAMSRTDLPNPEYIFIERINQAISTAGVTVATSIKRWNHEIFETDSVSETLSSLGKASFVQFTIRFILSLLLAGSEIATALAIWAGGKSVRPEQTLFGLSFICLISRRGLPTWVGSLLLLRFLRTNIFISLPGSYIDDINNKINVSDNKNDKEGSGSTGEVDFQLA